MGILDMWYAKISADVTQIPEMIKHYEGELQDARLECSIKGNLEQNAVAMPGVTEFRFNQLQELEAILNYLNLELRRLRRKHFQKYLEGYHRALTARDAEKYVDGEEEVVDFEIIINDVALIRNKYLGIMKALSVKEFQLSNVVRLRTAGMEDVTF